MSAPRDTRFKHGSSDPYAPPWVRDPNYRRHADRSRRGALGAEPAPAYHLEEPRLPRDFPELSRKRKAVHYALAVSAAAGVAYLMSWSNAGRVFDMTVQPKRDAVAPAAVVSAVPQLPEPQKSAEMSPDRKSPWPPANATVLALQLTPDVADPPAPQHRVAPRTDEPRPAFDTAPTKRPERLPRSGDAQDTATTGLASAPIPSTTQFDEETVAVLIERAEQFIKVGDFSSARADLRRPAESGNRKAATMLASTYDPAMFARHGVKGLAPDPEQARYWYERARSLGPTENQKPIGAPALREGEQWLIVGSSSDFETAVAMAEKYKPEFPTAMVLSSENGQYAVILGHFPENTGRAQLEKLKTANKVRQDSYLSVGSKLRDVAWR
jgi:hypothetical protein